VTQPPVLALVLAGGKSEALHALGRVRTASALPYGGKYRVIDFTLSNCVHSGIYRVNILTQYAPHSLQGHIGIGRPWDLDRREGGIRLLQPYVRQTETNWYRGTADALLQNRNVIADAQARHLLVLSGDLVYKMDYGELIRSHEERDASLTIATTHPPTDHPERYGYVDARQDGRVLGLDEKPARVRGGVVSAGIYVFRARELMARLADPSLGPDLVRDVILPMIREGAHVYAHPLRGYWRDVGTIDSYYESTMDLVRPVPPFNLYDPDWLIYTPSEDRAPAVVGEHARVHQSLVGHGTRVEGDVRRSVLFPGVVVERGARVTDSIVMHDARVASGARLDRAIVDKRVIVGREAVVGALDGVPNAEFPRDLHTGICVVGKGSCVPERARLGANTLIDIGVGADDYPSLEIPAGAVIRPLNRIPA